MRLIVTGIGVAAVVAGCGRNPCSQLARSVCEQAPNTPACDRASRMTNSDECAGLIQEVARFIALANEKVETPVLQPPAAPGGPDAPATPPETPPHGAVESPPVPETPTAPTGP